MITSKEIIFVDTNVLIYLQNKDDHFYKVVSDYHQKIVEDKIEAVISPQVVLEFSSAMSDPRKVIKPHSLITIRRQIRAYLNTGYKLIYPDKKTVETFIKLISKPGLVKKTRHVFDVFLAATMLSNGVKTILTANGSDFASIPQIKVIPLKAV